MRSTDLENVATRAERLGDIAARDLSAPLSSAKKVFGVDEVALHDTGVAAM